MAWRRQKGVREAELEALPRMRKLLETRKWPTGLGVTDQEAQIIRHNIELVGRQCVHEWVENWNWNGGPSEYPVQQCVRCNETVEPVPA